MNNDTTETTTLTSDAEETETVGHQMGLLSETAAHLGDNARDLQEAIDSLDHAHMAVVDADDGFGDVSEEDEAARALVAKELAAINRRLGMLVALANVRDAARRLGRVALAGEAEEESDATN
jgi:hypothetical protein